MFRLTLVLAALAALTAPALAQPPGGLSIIDAKVEKDKLTWIEAKAVPVKKLVEVTVNVNGMNVVQKQEVTVIELVSLTQSVELKTVKATDGRGRPIDAKDLAKQLKDRTPVVLLSGPITEKHRDLFNRGTVFIEMLPPEVPAPGLPPKL